MIDFDTIFIMHFSTSKATENSTNLSEKIGTAGKLQETTEKNKNVRKCEERFKKLHERGGTHEDGNIGKQMERKGNKGKQAGKQRETEEGSRGKQRRGTEGNRAKQWETSRETQGNKQGNRGKQRREAEGNRGGEQRET